MWVVFCTQWIDRLNADMICGGIDQVGEVEHSSAVVEDEAAVHVTGRLQVHVEKAEGTTTLTVVVLD